MKRIEVRGVIVPSSLDATWAEDYIGKGLITPESRFRKALAEAGDDVELYINSQGGSVFAGSEMVNALKQFKATGKRLEITVGSMAASMAANMVAMSGADKVRAHSNSKIMFHGAYGMTFGGKGAHEDSAALLAQINADVISTLSALPRADKTQVKGWFDEGREGWLSAKQALEMGLISEIIDAPASPLSKIPKEEAEKMLEGGLDIAAFDVGEPPAEPPKAEVTPEVYQAVIEARDRLQSELAESVKRMAGMQSAKDKEIAALLEEKATFETNLNAAKSALETVKAELSALATEKQKVEAALDAEVKQRVDAQKKHAALVGGVLKHDTTEQYADWTAAVAHLGYEQARKQQSALYADFMQSKNVHTKGLKK